MRPHALGRSRVPAVPSSAAHVAGEECDGVPLPLRTLRRNIVAGRARGVIQQTSTLSASRTSPRPLDRLQTSRLGQLRGGRWGETRPLPLLSPLRCIPQASPHAPSPHGVDPASAPAGGLIPIPRCCCCCPLRQRTRLPKRPSSVTQCQYSAPHGETETQRPIISRCLCSVVSPPIEIATT